MKSYMHNASDMRIVGTDSDTGQCHFRQKGSDKNHTGLSPFGISEIRGFVFTSNHVCSEGSMIIGLRFGTYFSHGIGVCLCIFGTYSSAQWFLTYYTSGPYQEIIALHCISVDSSTWYSSYMIHVGISFPTVATHRLCLPYAIYVPSTLIPTKPTYHRMLLTCQSPIPSSRQTTSIHLTFPLTSHQVTTSNVIAC